MSGTRVGPDTFRQAMGGFASGVTVVSVRDAGGADQGMAVSAFCSLSLDPPLALACIGHDATLAAAIASADHFGVSVLADDQERLARRFAEPDGHGFAGIACSRGAGGVALLDGALAHLECRIAARHAGGDHTIVVGEVLAARSRAGRPLVYFHGAYERLAP